MVVLLFFFFKQKTAYVLRISDWSSDVCASDLGIELAVSHHALSLAEQVGQQASIAHMHGVLEVGDVEFGDQPVLLHAARLDQAADAEALAGRDMLFDHVARAVEEDEVVAEGIQDRKSTRLNSSH